jgi:hypothetical protein
MRNIMRAIARLLGLQTQPTEVPAQPTPTAGPVKQGRTTPRGNKRSAQASSQQPQSVTKKRSSKPKAAQQTTAVSSRKAAPKSAPATRGQTGKQSATPAPQTQSPAPTQRKQKQEAAQSTTAARKLGKKKPTVRQVAMVSQSKLTGSKSKTPAR